MDLCSGGVSNIDGLAHGRTTEQTHKQTNKQTNGQANGETDKRMDKRADGGTNQQTDRWTRDSCKNWEFFLGWVHAFLISDPITLFMKLIMSVICLAQNFVSIARASLSTCGAFVMPQLLCKQLRLYFIYPYILKTDWQEQQNTDANKTFIVNTRGHTSEPQKLLHDAAPVRAYVHPLTHPHVHLYTFPCPQLRGALTHPHVHM